MTEWKLIRSPARSGLLNMSFDLELFNAYEKGGRISTLRIYSWEPQCISLGYAQRIEAEVDLEKAKALSWEVVKRPTGGGIVFHNRAEVTYSLVTAIDNPLLPPGLIPSYRKISEAIVAGLKKIGVKAEVENPGISNRTNSLCFAFANQYEIVVQGKKLVGSAQKRGRKALLQQGSILISPLPQSIFSVLKKPHPGYNAISLEEVLGRTPGFEEMGEAMIKGFEECFGIKFKSQN